MFKLYKNGKFDRIAHSEAERNAFIIAFKGMTAEPCTREVNASWYRVHIVESKGGMK